jgi:hypothetical protein
VQRSVQGDRAVEPRKKRHIEQKYFSAAESAGKFCALFYRRTGMEGDIGHFRTRENIFRSRLIDCQSRSGEKRQTVSAQFIA